MIAKNMLVLGPGVRLPMRSEISEKMGNKSTHEPLKVLRINFLVASQENGPRNN